MSHKSKTQELEFKVPPAFKFQEGEKVLCFHGPLIYEAKCLQSRYDEEEKTNKYHIHYSGWNKSWDEWVPETRVLKHNDANIQRQKELHKAQKAEPKGKKGKKRSISGKDKEGEGKEKDADDSRSSTPVIERGGGKASASATQSSSQESASDVPKRKRSKLDPSVESCNGLNADTRNLSPPVHQKIKARVLSTSVKTHRKLSLQARRRALWNFERKSGSSKSSLVDTEHSVKHSPPSESKELRINGTSAPLSSYSFEPLESPANVKSFKKLLLKRRVEVRLERLDLSAFKSLNGHFLLPISNGNYVDDLSTFGELVANRLERIEDQSFRSALKNEILKMLPEL